MRAIIALWTRTCVPPDRLQSLQQPLQPTDGTHAEGTATSSGPRSARRRGRDLARRIHATKDLPLLCLHGHVDISLFATDAPFGDPAELLVVPDHYVTRMLISQGISRAPRPAPPRRRPGGRPAGDLPSSARTGTCSGPPRAGTGWNTSSPRCSASPPSVGGDRGRAVRPDLRAPRRARLRPRALLDRFGIELISTTDAAADDLAQHAKVAADLPGRVVPTFARMPSSTWTGRTGLT